jgi:hypothetical protein
LQPLQQCIIPLVCDNLDILYIHNTAAEGNMWILPLVGYLGMAVGFGFLTLAIGMFADACAVHAPASFSSFLARTLRTKEEVAN